MVNTQEEITQGNVIIAKFMGFKELSDKEKWNLQTPELLLKNTEGLYYSYSELSYNLLWELLMPVVENICRLKVGDGIEYVEYSYPRTFGMLNTDTGQIMVRLNGHQLFEADTLIEACWLAVVDFCKYHNEIQINKW